MSKLKITLSRSMAHSNPHQKAVVKALGLRKRGHYVIQEDNPAIRGMCRKVSHLLTCEEVED